MKKQDVQKMMRSAFFDAMLELMDDEPDKAVEWLAKLHGELAWRLAKLLPGKQRDIDHFLDTETFAANLRAGIAVDLRPTVEFTWGLLGMACASDMDHDICAAKHKVLRASRDAMAPLFLKHAHEQLDEITRRIMELK